LEKEEFDGQYLRVNTDEVEWHNVFAWNGFPISRKQCGNVKELSTGITIYYCEVTVQWDGCWLVGNIIGRRTFTFTYIFKN
jgi:hypothetical protein